MRRREKKNVYRSQENIRHDSWDIAGKYALRTAGDDRNTVFIVVLHKWKKSTLLSIGGGTVFYMVLVQTIFG